MKADNMRKYQRHECVFFRKTKEQWGGLSNMASGYPIELDGIKFYSSEALYQCCRFPHFPDVQKIIIEQTNPMYSKRVTKPFCDDSRVDWLHIRIKIMKWCLRVKLINNFEVFSSLLLQTNDLPIVEWSSKDNFWGAEMYDNSYFEGVNALGRLLMELREELKNNQFDLYGLQPPEIKNFTILNKPVGIQKLKTDDFSNRDEQPKLL